MHSKELIEEFNNVILNIAIKRKKWKNMKNSKALINDVIIGKTPERTPIFDLLLNDSIIEHFSGKKFGEGDDFDVSLTAARNTLDATRLIALPNIDGATWTDGIGNIWESARWTSWIKKHAFSDIEGWKKYIHEFIDQSEAASDYSDEEKESALAHHTDLNSKLGETIFIYCTPSAAINTACFSCCGLEMFSYLWADEHELTLRWLRAIEKSTYRYINLMANKNTSPLAMIYSDVAYKNRLMFSKDMFNEIGFFEDIARICDECHKHGLKVIFHSDGYIMDIIPELIAAGIDGLNPIEKAAGMDIYQIRRKYPNLILVGGVDVTHLLPFGTPEEVRKETRNIINETGFDGKLLIGSSTELDNSIPLENYLAFHDEVLRG